MPVLAGRIKERCSRMAPGSGVPWIAFLGDALRSTTTRLKQRWLGTTAAAAVAQLCMNVAALACTPVDYLRIPVVKHTGIAIHDALLAAYPGSMVSDEGLEFSPDGIVWLPIGEQRPDAPAEVLRNASVREQFLYVYPMTFDLTERQKPFFDPGRPRNDAFFRALYAQDQETVRQSLVQVSAPKLSGVSYWVTTKWSVACQLEAALTSLSETNGEVSKYFATAGGGFNWRRISGTSRLSAHSFGIAIDINPQLGQYWKWTGAAEGAVGPYHNIVPEEIVSTMERYGFIWGGKWHHFDGMHFEYRPEIIIYSRLMMNDSS